MVDFFLFYFGKKDILNASHMVIGVIEGAKP